MIPKEEEMQHGEKTQNNLCVLFSVILPAVSELWTSPPPCVCMCVCVCVIIQLSPIRNQDTGRDG